MTDPYVEGIERLRDAITRLNSEQASDMRTIAERIAKLETLPRSIDDLRDEFREFQKELREVERDRDKRPTSRNDSLSGRTTVRVADVKGKWEFWKLVVGGILAFLTAALSVYSAAKVSQISPTKEIKRGE
jgi:hypothetical protein